MGYYSTLTFHGQASKINKEKLKKLNKSLKQDPPPFEGFNNTKITFDKNGNIDIDMDDYFRKFADGEKFAQELAKVIEEGEVAIEFTGENGERWGYWIENGKVEPLAYIVIPASKLKEIEEALRK